MQFYPPPSTNPLRNDGHVACTPTEMTRPPQPAPTSPPPDQQAPMIIKHYEMAEFVKADYNAGDVQAAAATHVEKPNEPSSSQEPLRAKHYKTHVSRQRCAVFLTKLSDLPQAQMGGQEGVCQFAPRRYACNQDVQRTCPSTFRWITQ